MKLFDVQKECVETIEKNFETHKKQCLAWYTGGGKTNIIIKFCEKKIKENPNVKIGISSYLTLEIRAQFEDRFKEWGLIKYVQVIKDNCKLKNKNVYIFNPQAVYGQKYKMKFDYFIIDEAHRGLSKETRMLNSLLTKFTNEDTKILLSTATPWDLLAQKRFKDIPVIKRSLEDGFKDGLTTDFNFHLEQMDVRLSDRDFTRAGEIKNKAIKRIVSLKSICEGKLKKLIESKDQDLGDKVLVICPPGNDGEIARNLAEKFGGLPFIQEYNVGGSGWLSDRFHTKQNLDKFKNDPNVRFLFVIYKCQIGFDMKELSSVIDLTMTRNISVLAQRFGRIARKNGKQDKNYFYCFDNGLDQRRLDWLIHTSIDFCMGNYDGWDSKVNNYKYREIYIRTQLRNKKDSKIRLTDVIRNIRKGKNSKTVISLRFVNTSPPKIRDLESAINEAKQYKSRTDMWRENPSLYKWFRLNNKDMMNELFPYKYKNIWTKQKIIRCMKECNSRIEFKKKYSSGNDWLRNNNLNYLKDKYLPPSRSAPIWTDDKIMEILSTLRDWGDLRIKHSGLRRWMWKNGGEAKYKAMWKDLIA